MLIRSEQPGDVDAIHELVASAFPTDAEARLIDKLREADRLTISLVAVLSNRIIGHIGFSPVTVAASQLVRRGLGLAPLAVAEDCRRQGIGTALVQAGIEQCRNAGIDYVVVLGDPFFYGRFGFQPGSRYDVCSEYCDGPEFQVLELADGGSPRGGGLLRYAPEFAMFDGGDAH
ncbi:MAG: GNAT family N-acetyltransferase [Pirellula sp.]|nr:GNAT family N-acetyltransferase [Pirellula sp.]